MKAAKKFFLPLILAALALVLALCWLARGTYAYYYYDFYSDTVEMPDPSVITTTNDGSTTENFSTVAGPALDSNLSLGNAPAQLLADAPASEAAEPAASETEADQPPAEAEDPVKEIPVKEPQAPAEPPVDGAPADQEPALPSE